MPADLLGLIDPFATFDPFLDIAGLIPVLNIFVGNGVDGLTPGANGGNAGLFIGNGGNGANGGFDPVTGTSSNGGNGGNAGLFFGSGGNGGNGVSGGYAPDESPNAGDPVEATHGGNGGDGAFLFGNGGNGGVGGLGRNGKAGVNPSTEDTAGPGEDGVGLQNGGPGVPFGAAPRPRGPVAGNGGAGGAEGGNGGDGGLGAPEIYGVPGPPVTAVTAVTALGPEPTAAPAAPAALV